MAICCAATLNICAWQRYAQLSWHFRIARWNSESLLLGLLLGSQQLSIECSPPPSLPTHRGLGCWVKWRCFAPCMGTAARLTAFVANLSWTFEGFVWGDFSLLLLLGLNWWRWLHAQLTSPVKVCQKSFLRVPRLDLNSRLLLFSKSQQSQPTILPFFLSFQTIKIDQIKSNSRYALTPLQADFRFPPKLPTNSSTGFPRIFAFFLKPNPISLPAPPSLIGYLTIFAAFTSAMLSTLFGCCVPHSFLHNSTAKGSKQKKRRKKALQMATWSIFILACWRCLEAVSNCLFLVTTLCSVFPFMAQWHSFKSFLEQWFVIFLSLSVCL